VLPANEKIAKDAKESVQECVSEFIAFVTSEASDRCQQEKRKTINGDDLLWALGTLGFEDYLGPLKIYLQVTKARQSEAFFSFILFCKPAQLFFPLLSSSRRALLFPLDALYARGCPPIRALARLTSF
jgi:hypothetical protein